MLGVMVGLGAGFLMARLYRPQENIPIAASRSPALKAEFVVLTAQSYTRNLDLGRAENRLELIPEERNAETFASLAQSALAAGRPEEARALAELAAALWPGLFYPPSATAAVVTQAPGKATPTSFLNGTPPQLSGTESTLLLTPTEASPAPVTYVLLAQEAQCPPASAAPLIQVVVLDAAGNPLPAVEVVVEWPGGRDHFFTGLKPELGLGYGDFEMTAGVAYEVYPLPDGEMVVDLQAPACRDTQGGSYPGSWRLIYRRP